MNLNESIEWAKAQRGELYRAFVPELIAARDRGNAACMRFNTATDLSRRNCVKLWRDITCDARPLPPVLPAVAEDDAQFEQDPWVMAPLHVDYGFNIHVGPGSFLNYNATFVDTCPIIIGARVLVGPNCSFYSGTHPVDPAIRNGLKGPESGKPINIGDDCWLGGNVIILPGVTIGKGSTIGAGSVVTKDIPAFHVAAGNPARVLRRIESIMNTEESNPLNSRVQPGPSSSTLGVPFVSSQQSAVDVETQCGVPLRTGSLCRRSLTCKSHTMGAKRAVPGRSLPYDLLLRAYQQRARSSANVEGDEVLPTQPGIQGAEVVMAEDARAQE